MNLGLEIVSSVVLASQIETLTENGFNQSWLNTPSASIIFTGTDKAAYDWVLRYHSKHHVVPSLTIFSEQFPEATYKLQENYIPLSQLVDLVNEKVLAYNVAVLIDKTIEFHDSGKILDAVKFIKQVAEQLTPEIIDSSGYDVTSSAFDIDSLLDTQLEKGIPFGFEEVDQAYWGFQSGQLITLLGRQKASKTFITLNSALHAWISGYSVLFFSVEMGESLLQQRLLALGAGVSPSRLRKGLLTPGEKLKVRTFQSELSTGAGKFIISKKKTLITVDDIAEETKKYKPVIVYIDGFSFMVDRKTGRMTDDWQANENVAAELKSFAMEKDIVVFVNTQVQEKQHNSSRGIEARTIAGGTGLLKASDYVIGLDKEKGSDVITFSSQRSRFEDFDDFNVEIDFETMSFNSVSLEQEADMKAKGI